MLRKVIFSVTLFLLLAGNCQAVSIIPIQDNERNAFQMTLDFIEEHPEYSMMIESNNHLFRGDDNKILACKYMPDGSTFIYNVYFDVGYPMSPKLDSQYFYHIFEHGDERQTWKFLTDNNIFLR